MSKKQSFEKQIETLDKMSKEQSRPIKPKERKIFEAKKPSIEVEVNENYVDEELSDDIDSYLEKAWTVENDTVYSRWGLLTEDKRYDDETENIVQRIARQHNLSNDQAHYFTYMMVSQNMTYEEAKEQLLSSKEFEQYDAIKKARRSEI